ncbi:hypothetical protein GCM10023323_52290 [Streptomyces thinghirensis]|uniref:Uncharacterized protein n=1 Tax=Streptomyces thinghirensis TaxID=551547 RepID=A0ABP9TC81_9ACTN
MFEVLDPLRLPSLNWLAGQREGTVGGRVAYRWGEVSQLTRLNKDGKSGIRANLESIARRWGGLRVPVGGRVGRPPRFSRLRPCPGRCFRVLCGHPFGAGSG